MILVPVVALVAMHINKSHAYFIFLIFLAIIKDHPIHDFILSNWTSFHFHSFTCQTPISLLHPLQHPQTTCLHLLVPNSVLLWYTTTMINSMLQKHGLNLTTTKETIPQWWIRHYHSYSLISVLHAKLSPAITSIYCPTDETETQRLILVTLVASNKTRRKYTWSLDPKGITDYLIATQIYCSCPPEIKQRIRKMPLISSLYIHDLWFSIKASSG